MEADGGTRSIEEIVEDIGKDFEDVPGAALEEITAFVDKLAGQGFMGLELKDKT